MSNEGVDDGIEDSHILLVISMTIYYLVFPEILRKKVRSKFDAQTWVEFCNRLGGVGLIMAVFGALSVTILESNLLDQIESIGFLNVMSTFYGVILLTIIALFLHLVGWVTKGGIPIPVNPTSRLGNLSYNIGRIIAGGGLIAGTFILLSIDSAIDRPLSEEVIQFVVLIGVLCLILAPIFYGFGLLSRGIFELVDEYRWRG